MTERMSPFEPPEKDLEIEQSQADRVSPKVTDVMTDYPIITLLSDAYSYPKENQDLYPGRSGEELRTAKSISVSRRMAVGDEIGLLGDNAEAMQQGYATYRDIVEKGTLDIGEGDSQLGQQRLENILAVHDIAKSHTASALIKERYGITDHDIALIALVEGGFSALEGSVKPEALEWLRNNISKDEKIRAFFSKERGIDPAFNVGRHLQGEADFELFKATVHEVDDVSLAEFTLDLLGADGHQDPDGPVKFASIPSAFNGIAAGLEKLIASKESGSEGDLYALWEELSYPQEDLRRLGLSRETEKDRA